MPIHALWLYLIVLRSINLYAHLSHWIDGCWETLYLWADPAIEDIISAGQATDHLSIDSPKPNRLLRTQNQLIWRSGLLCEPGATVVQQILIHIKMRVNQFNTQQNLYKANNYPGSRHLLTNQKHVLNILLLIAERYFLVYVSSHSPACYNFQHRL